MRTLSPRDGYALWAPTYDRILSGNLEYPLLEQCGLAWDGATILDCGCGTGRIGAWIRARADCVIDGIDISPDMLALARAKNLYRNLDEGDLEAEPPAGDPSYDIVLAVLAATHLGDLAPLMRRACRALRPGGQFLIIDYHPFMMLAGRALSCRDAEGEPYRIRNHCHLHSHYLQAAFAQPLRLTGCWESLVTAAWVERTPGLQPYLDKPIGLALRFART